MGSDTTEWLPFTGTKGLYFRSKLDPDDLHVFLILMIILRTPRKAPWHRRGGKEAGRSLFPCVQAFLPVPESELTTICYLTFQESLETKGKECMLGSGGTKQGDWCPLPLSPRAWTLEKGAAGAPVSQHSYRVNVDKRFLPQRGPQTLPFTWNDLHSGSSADGF